MAAEQVGTEGLVVGGQAAEAAKVITIPVDGIIESFQYGAGGAPVFEDVFDADGAHHTRVTYERGMHTCTIVLVGEDYTTKAAGQQSDGSDEYWYLTSVSKEYSRGPIRTTITAEALPTEPLV